MAPDKFELPGTVLFGMPVDRRGGKMRLPLFRCGDKAS
jgi:hypothetical protein